MIRTCNNCKFIDSARGSIEYTLFCSTCEGYGSSKSKWVSKDYVITPNSMSPSEREAVNHPAHYNTGKYEVIDVIEDWQLGFNAGNAVKYLARAEHKGNPVEDLEKAAWYVRREIERLKQQA